MLQRSSCTMYLSILQVKVWFQNRRMKWKRVKGTKLAKDKVDGHLKPIMAPNVSSTDSDDLHQNVISETGNTWHAPNTFWWKVNISQNCDYCFKDQGMCFQDQAKQLEENTTGQIECDFLTWMTLMRHKRVSIHILREIVFIVHQKHAKTDQYWYCKVLWMQKVIATIKKQDDFCYSWH